MSVSGPFWLDAKNNICRHGSHCSSIVLTPMLPDDPYSGVNPVELCDLLNKGTHFDGMLAALQGVARAVNSHPDDAVAHLEALGRSIRHVCTAIDNAVPRDADPA